MPLVARCELNHRGAVDVDTERHLRVVKGGGTASVPVHPRIVEALGMAPMRDGVWWERSASHVSRQVSEHFKAAGVNATAHQLRHYAGTAW